MLKPQNAINAVPNRESILHVLESYTDQILAMELTADTEKPIVVVYNGGNYHRMRRFIRQFIVLYDKFYDIKDITGTKKYVYVLEFTPIGL